MGYFSSPDNASSQIRKEDLLHVISTQLSQATVTMLHVDEVFLWLVDTIVKHFDATVAQVWAMQATTTGQRLSPQLRSMMCQNASIPHNVVVNAHIADLVESMLQEQRVTRLCPVEACFSQHLALLLQRYELYYCADYSMCSDTLLPPPRLALPAKQKATPLAMTLFLFFRSMPHEDTLPAIQYIVALALSMARSRGLLRNSALPSTEPSFRTKSTQDELAALIPCRAEDPTRNPLAVAGVLPERQLRRVYMLINDRRNIAQISQLTHLGLKDVLGILHKLVAMQQVQLYEPTGRRVENISRYDE